MFRRLLSVGGFTLLSRILGFTRDILMAAMLGAGTMSDAFVVAFLFPNYFRAMFGEGTINPAFLPRYAAHRARGELREAVNFGDAVFSWQMAAQLVILVAALGLMPWLVRILAPGFADNAGQMALTAHLARITFPYLILTVVAVQLSAMLNALEKFAAAAAWPALLNVAMITALASSAWFPNAAEAAAWGVLAGGLLQLGFILWAAKREGLDLRIGWPRWTPEIKEFFVAFGAVTFGAASVMLAPLIDTVLASFPRNRQPDRALLCRSHQPIAARRAWHRARHRAAAGDEREARARRHQRLQCRAEPRRRALAAADPALLGRLRRHPRYGDARDLCPWRLQPAKPPRWPQSRCVPMAWAFRLRTGAHRLTPPSMPAMTR